MSFRLLAKPFCKKRSNNIFKISFILLSLLFFNTSFSQNLDESPLLIDGKLYIDSLYQDKNERIIFSAILQYDGIPRAELIKKVKNWAGTQFVNLKEVLVGETEDQIVLNYITSSYYVKTMGIKTTIDWYIRLVIQFKDNKIRCQFFDDGNVFIPGSQFAPAVSARTYKLKDYFKEDDATLIARKPNTLGLVALHNSVISTFESMKNELDKKESSKKDDW